MAIRPPSNPLSPNGPVHRPGKSRDVAGLPCLTCPDLTFSSCHRSRPQPPCIILLFSEPLNTSKFYVEHKAATGIAPLARLPVAALCRAFLVDERLQRLLDGEVAVDGDRRFRRAVAAGIAAGSRDAAVSVGADRRRGGRRADVRRHGQKDQRRTRSTVRPRRRTGRSRRGSGPTGRMPASGASMRLIRLAALALARAARASARFCSARSNSTARFFTSATWLA